MIIDFEQFGQNLNLLLANSLAIALWIRVLEFTNHQGSARLMKER
ncbi:MAG: hypothetical protein QNJ37_22215 [Crocosphaera sp.]|nr:hypothetical protein [Crocosphaera sp.]